MATVYRIRSRDDLEEHDLRLHTPRFIGDDFERNLALLGDFEALAERNDCTMAQLALSWVLAQGDSLIPIPGTKHVAFVEENAGAADLEISEVDLRRAGELIGPATVSGERYAAARQISLDPEEDA